MSKKAVYLVGVDGSEWSKRAVERAVGLAKQTGAKVKFITVIPWSGFQPLTLDEMAHRPLEKKQEEATAREKILNPMLDAYQDSGVEIVGEFSWGHPVETLHKISKSDHAELIFLGRRGRSRIADLLLGSVANSLAHTAGIPVVLVP